MSDLEKINFDTNGQWNLEKRCWEGYKPVPGKKAYSEGSCEPVKKDDKPHLPGSPEDSAHDVVEENSDLRSEMEDLSPEEKEEMLRHLRMLKDKRAHRSMENRIVGKNEDMKIAPEKSKNRKTYLENFEKSDIQLEIYDNEDMDLFIGEDVPDHIETNIVNSILKKGYLEQSGDELVKKEWSPKAEHKSDKGGLTAKGRESYNRATGGHLKAPQPGGGPRKRSFCARNKGQIDMHNIDCKKTPEKRACKARRRWKC